MKKNLFVAAALCALLLPLGAQVFYDAPGSAGESYHFSFTWDDLKDFIEGNQKGFAADICSH